jgi:hypothetical protein
MNISYIRAAPHLIDTYSKKALMILFKAARTRKSPQFTMYASENDGLLVGPQKC